MCLRKYFPNERPPITAETVFTQDYDTIAHFDLITFKNFFFATKPHACRAPMIGKFSLPLHKGAHLHNLAIDDCDVCRLRCRYIASCKFLHNRKMAIVRAERANIEVRPDEYGFSPAHESVIANHGEYIKGDRVVLPDALRDFYFGSCRIKPDGEKTPVRQSADIDHLYARKIIKRGNDFSYLPLAIGKGLLRGLIHDRARLRLNINVNSRLCIRAFLGHMSSLPLSRNSRNSSTVSRWRCGIARLRNSSGEIHWDSSCSQLIFTSKVRAQAEK